MTSCHAEKTKMRKHNPRKIESFAAFVSDPKILSQEIYRSVLTGGRNQRGHLFEKIVKDVFVKSGRYDKVDRELVVVFTDGEQARQIHKVDIVTYTSTHVNMWNVKSRTTSGTDDPNHTVITYERALREMKKKFPERVVQYGVLRLGGYEIPEWTARGFQTFDLNTVLSEHAGYSVNVEEEDREQIFLKNIEEYHNLYQQVADRFGITVDSREAWSRQSEYVK